MYHDVELKCLSATCLCVVMCILYKSNKIFHITHVSCTRSFSDAILFYPKTYRNCEGNDRAACHWFFCARSGSADRTHLLHREQCITPQSKWAVAQVCDRLCPVRPKRKNWQDVCHLLTFLIYNELQFNIKLLQVFAACTGCSTNSDPKSLVLSIRTNPTKYAKTTVLRRARKYPQTRRLREPGRSFWLRQNSLCPE